MRRHPFAPNDMILRLVSQVDELAAAFLHAQQSDGHPNADPSFNAEAWVSQVQQLAGAIHETATILFPEAEGGEWSLIEERNTRVDVLADMLGPDRMSFLLNARLLRFIRRRAVYWGYMDLAHSEPLFSQSDRPVIFHVIVAINKRNAALREDHGWGYHYHYADAQGRRRSDVLFTFQPGSATHPWVLMWEYHAVRKASFLAHVANWGRAKRASVQDVCDRDAAGMALSAFVKPGKSALRLV